MSTPIRLEASWPFPSYIFIPGVNPHPKKSGGHMEGEGDPVAPLIDVSAPEKNKFLRYSLDLYNHHYYWESHVYFEALWNAHKREGSVADFLKGMIKLGAAGVKFTINQKEAANGHFERAIELFESVRQSEGDEFLGFNLKNLVEQIKLNQNLSVIPSWK
jgi:hypothetical protein